MCRFNINIMLARLAFHWFIHLLCSIIVSYNYLWELKLLATKYHRKINTNNGTCFILILIILSHLKTRNLSLNHVKEHLQWKSHWRCLTCLYGVFMYYNKQLYWNKESWNCSNRGLLLSLFKNRVHGKSKESILTTYGGGFNVLEAKFTILIYQLIGGPVQIALCLLLGNVCLVQACVVELLQCLNLPLCRV